MSENKSGLEWQADFDKWLEWQRLQSEIQEFYDKYGYEPDWQIILELPEGENQNSEGVQGNLGPDDSGLRGVQGKSETGGAR